MIPRHLDDLNVPYVDDSNAVTPTSDELCNWQYTHTYYVNPMRGRRLSSTGSYQSKTSSHVDGGLGGKFMAGVRRDSFASRHSQHSTHGVTERFKHRSTNREPTHFTWGAARLANNKPNQAYLPEVVVDKSKSDDNVRYTVHFLFFYLTFLFFSFLYVVTFSTVNFRAVYA